MHSRSDHELLQNAVTIIFIVPSPLDPFLVSRFTTTVEPPKRLRTVRHVYTGSARINNDVQYQVEGSMWQ